jgi:hypothetical protein
VKRNSHAALHPTAPWNFTVAWLLGL